MATKQRKRSKRIVWTLILLIVSVSGYLLYPYYELYSASQKLNVLSEREQLKVVIEQEVAFKNLGQYMEQKGWILDGGSFLKVVEHKKWEDELMLPGIQTIDRSWDNKTLINQLFLSRNIGEVEITVNNVRLKDELAEKLSARIVASKEEILELICSRDFCNKYGFDEETIMTMFLPDTYRIKYRTSASELIDRMASEYKKFWTDSNRAKASRVGLSQSEVSILASIVQAEQNRKLDEQPDIARLYLNRLKIGMRLESDPTLVYAHGDFTVTWVKDEHKEIDSPYNTYKHLGLPPGPINLPEKSAILSVLNPADNEYLFMCAKPETGGYHNFSKSYQQHRVYAKEYQKWNREFHRKNRAN